MTVLCASCLFRLRVAAESLFRVPFQQQSRYDRHTYNNSMSFTRYADAHANPNGAGDARPTALAIVEDEGLVGKLTGKVMLVTGCSSGIGVETARALHATGADVFMTVRDIDKGKAVVQDISAGSQGKGKLELLKLELDSLQSVKECAKDFLSKSQQLNVLVNNAGGFVKALNRANPALNQLATVPGETNFCCLELIAADRFGHWIARQLVKRSHTLVPSELVALGVWSKCGLVSVRRDPLSPDRPIEYYLISWEWRSGEAAAAGDRPAIAGCVLKGVMACPEGQTKDGFETQFGTNHVGHFLLFQLLKPALLASSTPEFNSRVVCISSSGHNMSPVLFDDLNFKKVGYQPWQAYGQSKTANIYMANEIDRRCGSQGLHATSVMPGGIFTPLQRHVDEGTLKKWQDSPEIVRQMKSTEQGAATTVWAAIGKEWEGKGGKYLEDCSVALPKEGEQGFRGHSPYAYDEAAATKLWEVSLGLVGLEEDK